MADYLSRVLRASNKKKREQDDDGRGIKSKSVTDVHDVSGLLNGIINGGSNQTCLERIAIVTVVNSDLPFYDYYKLV